MARLGYNETDQGAQHRHQLHHPVGRTNKRNYSKMKRTLTALTVAATMFASSAYAFDPDDLQKLLDTNECRKCGLVDADLNDANLSNADLSGAYLWRANLWLANLSNADLSGANLYGAKLNGAILCNTTMPDGSVIYSGC